MARDNKLSNDSGLSDLNALWTSTKKKFGEDSTTILGKFDIKNFVKWVPLDSPGLTEVFGAGIPRGRVLECWGKESSGKTSLATYMAAQFQKYYFEDKGRFGNVAYIDAEHAYDPEYALAFGLDPDRVLFSTPDSAEQALDMISHFQESDKVDLIVLDSVGGLTPQAELDGEMGDAHMAILARLLSKHLRKVTANTTATSATLLYLNQTRIDIGAYHSPGTPPVEKPLGGNALKFYATIRFEVKKRENVEVGGKAIGIISTISVKKNKVAPPFKKVDITNIWGKGFDSDPEFFPFFCRYGLIDRNASGWCKFVGVDGEPIKLQGEAQVQNYLKSNPDFLARMKARLQEVMTGKKTEELKEFQKSASTSLPTGNESEDEVEKGAEEEEAAETLPDEKLVSVTALPTERVRVEEQVSSPSETEITPVPQEIMEAAVESLEQGFKEETLTPPSEPTTQPSPEPVQEVQNQGKVRRQMSEEAKRNIREGMARKKAEREAASKNLVDLTEDLPE